MKYLGLLVLCSFVLFGCQRKVDQSRSSIIIKAPNTQSKVGAFAALPANRKACFGVSVSGPGIIGSADSCTVQTGVIGGFVESGKNIELSVERGSQRKIQLFLYLLPENSIDSCPVVTGQIPKSYLSALYLVGSVENLELTQDTQTVEIIYDFPGISQTLASQLTLPTSCGVGPTTGSGNYSVSMDERVVSNANHTLRARVGKPIPGKVSTGGGYTLIGNVK